MLSLLFGCNRNKINPIKIPEQSGQLKEQKNERKNDVSKATCREQNSKN